MLDLSSILTIQTTHDSRPIQTIQLRRYNCDYELTGTDEEIDNLLSKGEEI